MVGLQKLVNVTYKILMIVVWHGMLKCLFEWASLHDTCVYPHVQQDKACRLMLKLIMSVVIYSASGSHLCVTLWFLFLAEGCKFDNPLQFEHRKIAAWNSQHCTVAFTSPVLHKHSLFPRISFFQELGSRNNVVRGSNSGTSCRFSLP